ncbi:MAG: hypothetical protein RLZZ297_193 [Chloroflexota bacterium]|jgi:hypothetical protein
MRWAVVPHQDELVGHIHRIELGERAAGADAVHQEHGHGGFQITFAGTGHPLPRQQRGADDEVCGSIGGGHAGDAPMVVTQRIEAVVTHQSIEAKRRLGRVGQPVFGDRPRDAIDAHRCLGKGTADVGNTLFHIVRGAGLAGVGELVELEPFDVRPQLGVEHRRVAIHVEHPRVRVTQHADAGVAQRSDRPSSPHPLGDAAPGTWVVVERARDDLKGDVGTPEGIGNLGDTAGRTRRQPIGGVGVGVVELGDGLQIEHQHLGIRALDDGEHLRRRRVGGSVADEQIDLGRGEVCPGSGGGRSGIDHPRADDLGTQRGKLRRDDGVVLQQLLTQPGELPPVRFEADGEQPDTRAGGWDMLHL